jgi:acid phosphatase type 7
MALSNSELRDSTTFGVLVLTLYEDHYDWEFVPVAGESFTDRGEGVCHP